MQGRIRNLAVGAVLLSMMVTLEGQDKPFAPVSILDIPTIAGRPVQLDATGKLLPWPMPDNIGYSYSSYFLSQWTIVWDQYNRQRLPYYYCCFDFDRTTFELQPDPHWANSTGYLRAMMEGFIERLYPYTGKHANAHVSSVVRRLRAGAWANSRRIRVVAGAIRLGESRSGAIQRMEQSGRGLHRAACCR